MPLRAQASNREGLTLARKPCFATFAGVRGGGGVRPLLGVSKRSVVKLRGKDQQIALAEYSRLVVLFLILGLYLTQLWQVKGQIFANSYLFISQNRRRDSPLKDEVIV